VTTAEDFDPYLLALPTPASPVVAPQLATSLHAHLNSRYGDPVWQLAPLTGNPSTVNRRIDWQTWPAAFREEMRLAVWNLINGQLRPTFLQEHARMRGRPGVAAIHITAMRWRALAIWLQERGIRTLAGCDATVLHDYGQHLRDPGGNRLTVHKHLVALTRLWALDQISARPSGIARPPWEELGADDYLPVAASAGGGENATEPLAEQTIGPLLIWTMRLVEDLSRDILTGSATTKPGSTRTANSKTTSARFRPWDTTSPSPKPPNPTPLPYQARRHTSPGSAATRPAEVVYFRSVHH
jgi:hypothetical protein